MRFRNEVLWRIYMTRIHAKRDGVVTEEEEAIMREIEFKVIDKDTHEVVTTNVLDFESGKHLVPDDQDYPEQSLERLNK